ncbi:MAG TPA: cupin domain-containing protein [Dehalococcoidia bacterium]|nr:cupin domain-containing protein [Dehalococcoidia bacterium]
MQSMGNYEVLSHVEMAECSLRILRLRQGEHVSPHYHRECVQIYTVLESEVEIQVGERTYRLLPYETVRVEKGVVHALRPGERDALVLSLSIPPLQREDHHVVA